MVTLFVIEDSYTDQYLLSECCKRASKKSRRFAFDIYYHDGGQDAVSFIQRKAAYIDYPKPDLFLIDYNLGSHYSSFVATIRVTEDIVSTPIFLYSSCLPDPALNIPRERKTALRQLGCIDDFIHKPVKETHLQKILRHIAAHKAYTEDAISFHNDSQSVATSSSQQQQFS